MVEVKGLDSNLFDLQSVDAETKAYVEQLEVTFASVPPPYTQDINDLRASARSGRSVFGPIAVSELAANRIIPGFSSDVPVRIFSPPKVQGIYIYFHGGGWMQGSADLQDKRLEDIALACDMVVVSVDYRLAPEHPYPSAPDDAEAVALWLAEAGMSEFGTDRLIIGGESAGAHLSAVTILRMRDKHGYTGFKGANLLYGAYDLTSTPSARAWGDRYLVLSGQYIEWCLDLFVPKDKRSDPDVSPLYADLKGLPPALFSVGTVDPLLDDTLFMYCRWLAAGNEAEIAVYPGATHAFPLMPITIAQEARERCASFMTRVINT